AGVGTPAERDTTAWSSRGPNSPPTCSVPVPPPRPGSTYHDEGQRLGRCPSSFLRAYDLVLRGILGRVLSLVVPRQSLTADRVAELEAGLRLELLLEVGHVAGVGAGADAQSLR